MPLCLGVVLCPCAFVALNQFFNCLYLCLWNSEAIASGLTQLFPLSFLLPLWFWVDVISIKLRLDASRMEHLFRTDFRLIRIRLDQNWVTCAVLPLQWCPVVLLSCFAAVLSGCHKCLRMKGSKSGMTQVYICVALQAPMYRYAAMPLCRCVVVPLYRCLQSQLCYLNDRRWNKIRSAVQTITV